MQALLPDRVLTADGWREHAAVLIDGARIVDIVARDDARVAAATRVDLAGRILAPGFIDAQVNGGGGVLFNDAPSVASIRAIGAAHRRYGTTGFLPTLISDDRSVMHAAVAAADAAIDAGVPGVLGVHLEGPFLAPARKGVHDAAKFRAIDADDVALIAAPRAGRVLLTLAPETVPPAVLQELARRGVIVAAGHTAADWAQTRAALAAGVRGFTHLFNAMTPFTSREPGAVGAALEDASSWCGLIVDGHHVHAASLRVAIAAKARGKMFLVTDAMPPVGSQDPTFRLNGETITCRDGLCLDAAGTLAGSALDMASAVRNTVRDVGVPLDEALRMAAAYPADFLRVDDRYGRIAPGLRASLVALDAQLRVTQTWIDGVTYHHA